MKQVLLLISVVLLFFTTNTNAQLKPAQSQYLVEKGVLINPSFEQGYQGWVITGCTKSLVSDTPYLNKSLKLTCTNETFSIKQVSTALTSFSKQQGAFDLQIKTTASGVNVSSITNGVRDNAYSVLDSTTFKRFKEIGFIVGDTDNGIEVYSDTNFTGEIIVDNFKLELGNLTQEIGAAHFVGSFMHKTTGCSFNYSTAAWGKMPRSGSCPNDDLIGNITTPDDNTAGVKILNARTDVIYEVQITGLKYYSGSGGICRYVLSETGTDNSQNGVEYTDSDTRATNQTYGTFKFSSSGDKTIYLTAFAESGATCQLSGNTANTAKYTVKAFPDSKKTIVSQDTELTAKTVNKITIRTSSTTVISTDFGLISDYSISDSGGGRLLFDYSSLSLTVIPNVSIIAKYNTGVSSDCATSIADIHTTSQIEFFVRCGGTGYSPTEIEVEINKQGADVNKSQTIVGSFEQIRSDDLCIVDARGSAAQTITANTEPIQFNTTEFKDNCNAWDGDEFTAPKTTRIFITGSYQNSTNGAFSVDVADQDGLIKVCSGANVVANNIRGFTCTLDVNAGDVVSMRLNTTLTSAGDPNFHHISISEISTKESIVANLMQGQTTKCQTKILSAPTASTGIIADLTMSNMTIGKKYEATFHLYEENNALTNIEHNGSILARTYIVGGTHIYTINTGVFTATAETLTINKTNTPITQGNGTKDSTWLQLCELPETVIETTEFN